MKKKLEWIARKPLLIVQIGTFITVGLLILLGWSGKNIFQTIQGVRAQALNLEAVVEASLLDGHLTRAARTFSVTGDPDWDRRYENATQRMDKVIEELSGQAELLDIRQTGAVLQQHNAELVRLEREAIRLALAGQAEAAHSVLSSERYDLAKKGLTQSLETLTEALDLQLGRHQEAFSSTATVVASVAILGTLTLLILWLLTFILMRKYVYEREQARVRELQLGEATIARDAAERASQAKNEFLGRMSHELRTPLNAILGFGQLLESDPTVEDQESVGQILRGGRHLLGLIDEVLDVARIEAGGISLSLEPVCLSEVLTESIDIVSHMAKRKEITLGAVTAIQSDTYVRADRQRLKQVIVNLLSNAIKYNHIGGRVQVHTQRTGDNRLRIEVRDSGYGIPADKLHRVFSPFDRLDAENTGEEGTGLGLALSQRLVEIMNGTIGVESIEGEGSTFWVELALAEAPVLQQAKEVSDATEVGEASTDQATVLFVEDNLANVRLMERILARRPNTRLISAMQGSLGFELAREHQPSLILLDLNLPDISGKEVLERLKNDPATQKIPVVMVSADAMPKQIDRLLDAGAKDYLTKPVDVDHMLRIVDEVLRREDGHRGRNN